MLQKEAKAPTVEEQMQTRSFDSLNLYHGFARNLKSQNIERMTEIQEGTWDPLMEGENVLGLARTGSGKTLAFLLPLLQRKMDGESGLKALVISPTRELAGQIGANANKLVAGTNIKAACFTGGTDMLNDIRHLHRKPEIVIGTPGRLMDLLERGHMDLRGFSVLILDEFDRMLDMGFVDDVHMIASAMPQRQQTLLFSATVQGRIEPEIKRILDGAPAVRVEVNKGDKPNESVQQEVVHVPEGGTRFDTLVDVLKEKGGERVLVFSETKRGVSKITARLKKAGVAVDEIHGDKSQNYRNRALDKFKKGKIRVLVATDVAARGLDIPLVSDVINVEIPRTYDSYIHRIGRTGRAGNLGRAFTIVEGNEGRSASGGSNGGRGNSRPPRSDKFKSERSQTGFKPKGQRKFQSNKPKAAKDAQVTF